MFYTVKYVIYTGSQYTGYPGSLNSLGLPQDGITFISCVLEGQCAGYPGTVAILVQSLAATSKRFAQLTMATDFKAFCPIGLVPLLAWLIRWPRMVDIKSMSNSIFGYRPCDRLDLDLISIGVAWLSYDLLGIHLWFTLDTNYNSGRFATRTSSTCLGRTWNWLGQCHVPTYMFGCRAAALMKLTRPTPCT